jgi:hypothetical protein
MSRRCAFHQNPQPPVFVRLAADAPHFAATRRIFSFSVKLVWHELLQMPTSETSRTVGRRFSRITARTFLT